MYKTFYAIWANLLQIPQKYQTLFVLFANYTVYLLTLLQDYAILCTSFIFAPLLLPWQAYSYIRAHAHSRTIYTHAYIHAYTHTQLHVYTHAFNIYGAFGWAVLREYINMDIGDAKGDFEVLCTQILFLIISNRVWVSPPCHPERSRRI